MPANSEVGGRFLSQSKMLGLSGWSSSLPGITIFFGPDTATTGLLATVDLAESVIARLNIFAFVG